MRLYEPKIEVRLVKAIHRKFIIPDVAVSAERYGSLDAIDLTDYLGESGHVQLSKGIRDPSGSFSITIPDSPHKTLRETLYALIEPMDLVEIRMAHDPFDYAKKDEGYRHPVVMRGLVSSVSRNEVMSGGKPMRTVTIAGQDFGKILQIIQIFYLNNSVVGDNLLTEFGFFAKYGMDGQEKIKSVKEFVVDVIGKVINPYLKTLTALADGKSVSAQIINEWTANVTAEGVISPQSLSSFNNVSLHQLLKTVLDVGPFNEMYVEDMPDGVDLVVRPAPFMTAGDKEIQGVKPTMFSITSDDVIALNVSRSDAGVANYYWASNSRWSMWLNEDAKRLAMVGPAGSFILYEYLNSNANYYGVRKMEVESVLGPSTYTNSESCQAAAVQADTNELADWLSKRRSLLATINKDNVVFESGTIRLRGNEKIKAGTMLEITRGADVKASYYVVKVDHDFIPFGGFYTTVTVERGTGFIKRSQTAKPEYRHEIDGKGVV